MKTAAAAGLMILLECAAAPAQTMPNVQQPLKVGAPPLNGAARVVDGDGKEVISVNPDIGGDIPKIGTDYWELNQKKHSVLIGGAFVGTDYNGRVGSDGQLLVYGNPDGPDGQGCLICAYAGTGSIWDQTAGLSGTWPTGGAGAISSYGDADTVNEYLADKNLNPTVLVNPSGYTKNSIILKTPLTALQISRIRKGQYVMTNSVDPGLTRPVFGAGLPLPKPTFYAGTVAGVSDATHIAVYAWAVPGARNSSANQVPSISHLDTAWTSFGVPTAGIGASSNTGNFNHRMDYSALNKSWVRNFGDEIDIGADRATKAGQYRSLGLAIVMGGASPTSDSWMLNLNGGNMPSLIELEGSAAGKYIHGSSILVNGNGGVSNVSGQSKVMFENDAFTGATNNMRLVGWLKNDSGSIGYTGTSAHYGLIVDGLQGSVGKPQSQLVFDPPATGTGGVGLYGYNGNGVNVTGNGNVSLGGALTVSGPASFTSVVNMRPGSGILEFPKTTGLPGGSISGDADGDITFATKQSGGKLKSTLPVVFPSYTYANLPATGTIGQEVECSDCLKPGEPAGRGTGMLVFDDSHSHWVSTAGTTAAH